MSVVRARLQSYSLPLRDPWPSAEGDVTDRRGWIVSLEDDLGRVGLGDAAPFPGFGLETYASAGAALKLALPRLVGGRRDAFAAAIAELPLLRPVAAAPTARAAIDCALHDLLAQAAELPLARYLGGEATLRAVPVNVAIPRVPPGRAAEAGLKAVGAGVGTLKLKVGGVPRLEDHARVRALRDAVGPEIRIRVDANQAWSVDEAIETLRSLAEFGLEYAEQPVLAEDIDGLARVRASSPVPIAADEAVRSAAAAREILYRAAADILVLKPMAVGGLREARAVLNAAAERNVPVVVTSLVESVVGRAAALHFAASLGATLHAHGIATGDALARDLAPSPVLTRGTLAISESPGLGVTLPGEFWHDAIIFVAE